MDIHIIMLYRRNPLQLYSVDELQSAAGDMKLRLMFVHAISGCDTVFARPLHERLNSRSALKVICTYGGQDSLSIFTEQPSRPYT